MTETKPGIFKNWYEAIVTMTIAVLIAGTVFAVIVALLWYLQ